MAQMAQNMSEEVILIKVVNTDSCYTHATSRYTTQFRGSQYIKLPKIGYHLPNKLLSVSKVEQVLAWPDSYMFIEISLKNLVFWRLWGCIRSKPARSWTLYKVVEHVKVVVERPVRVLHVHMQVHMHFVLRSSASSSWLYPTSRSISAWNCWWRTSSVLNVYLQWLFLCCPGSCFSSPYQDQH